MTHCSGDHIQKYQRSQKERDLADERSIPTAYYKFAFTAQVGSGRHNTHSVYGWLTYKNGKEENSRLDLLSPVSRNPLPPVRAKNQPHT